MLDERTLRSNVALAKKGIEAVSDESKTAVIDQDVVNQRRNNHDLIVQALNEAGVATLVEKPPQSPSESSTSSDPASDI